MGFVCKMVSVDGQRNPMDLAPGLRGSLLPRREDIIPRWSQLLTTLLSRGSKNHSEEEVMVVCNTLVKIL